MGCVARYPKNPKLKFVHEVRVSHIHRDRSWFLELLAASLARAATGADSVLHSSISAGVRS